MSPPVARVRHRPRRARPRWARRSAPRLLLGALVVIVCVLVVRAALEPDVGRYGLPLDRGAGSPAVRALAVDASSVPGPERRALRTIGSQPLSTWLTDAASAAHVPEIVAGAAKRRAVAVLVLYRIPNRDCGSYSASGGAASVDEYRTWLREVLAGLGRHRALVILEPDALAHLDCLDPAAATIRLDLMREAIGQVVAQGSWLYVDAGHSGWVPSSVMAARLRAVGADRATGLSLNVANFGSTAAETAYGTDLVHRIGGSLHLVIDTSRNGGTVAAGDWCNPPGSRLGAEPTVRTGDPLVDAYLWVKTPGVSDGSCNGGPPAGVVWPAYALALTDGPS